MTSPLSTHDSPALGGRSESPGSGQEPGLGGRAAVPDLLAALRGTDLQQRLLAARVLKRLKDPQAISMLLSALEDENTQVRSVAAAALGAIGAERSPRTRQEIRDLAVPALIHALHDRQVPMRMAAARALGAIGSPEAAADLMDALGDASPHVRGLAAEALGRIGGEHPSAGVRAQKMLAAALKDIDSAVRTHAAVALGRVSSDLKQHSLRIQVVPDLLDAFRDASVQVRSAAARSLSQIGPDSVPGLIEALRDEDLRVRSAAVWVLEQIGEHDNDAALRAVEPLIAALDDSDEHVRWYAVGALGVIRDARAVPRLVNLLDDTDGDFYYNEKRICDLAAEALERIGTPEARAAVRIWRVGQGG